MLEEWLADARKGKLRGVALVGIFKDGTVETDFDGIANGLEMIGALEHAKLGLYDLVKVGEE